MSFTLPRSLLFKTADFEFLFKNGKKKFSSFFVVYFRPVAVNESGSRLGLVVAKKSAGGIVKRNLVKRQIRESYRLRQHEFPAFQVLVVASKKVKEAGRGALRADLERLWGHVK